MGEQVAAGFLIKESGKRGSGNKKDASFIGSILMYLENCIQKKIQYL